MEVETRQSCCSIDRRLLPVKALLFSFEAGSHGFLTYRTIFYKHLGVSSYEVGLILLIECIFSLAMTPILGIVTDKLKKPKLVLIITILIGIFSVISQYFLPYVEDPFIAEIYQLGFTNLAGNKTTTNFAFTLNETQSCQINECALRPDQSCELIACREDLTACRAVTGHVTANETACCEVTCLEPDLASERKFSETFWLLLAFVLLSSFAHRGSETLVNSSVLTILGEKDKDKFGRQLLWSAIGGSVFISSVGLLKDFTANYLGVENRLMFIPMFACSFIFWSISAISCNVLPIKHTTQSPPQMQDIKKILFDIKYLAFFITLIAYGIAQAMVFNYLFWFAEKKLQASGSVLGLSTIAGMFTIVPMFFNTGKLIRTFGCDALISFTMFTFGVRFYLYTILTEAWMLIPMELFRAISYALAWTAICTQASNIAPKGLENTTMAIVYTMTWNIGSGAGAALGGFLYENYGGDWLFIVTAFISFASAFIYPLFTVLYRLFSAKRGGDAEDESHEEGDDVGEKSCRDEEGEVIRDADDKKGSASNEEAEKFI